MKTNSYPDIFSPKVAENLHPINFKLKGVAHKFYTLFTSVFNFKCACPIIAAYRRFKDKGKFDEHAFFADCEQTTKNIIDFVFALVALILLSPFLVFIALAIKVETKGDLFYAPFREGKNGKFFQCLKFRTMYSEACDDPRNGKNSTKKNDSRITPLGRVLRKYSLDELPQLINVLKGEMSLVGPRPHRESLHEEFCQVSEEYELRFRVKPGLTGWAQVNGWRGPTETRAQKFERIKHDVWYVNHRSIWLDFKIMWRTIFRGGLIDPLAS